MDYYTSNQQTNSKMDYKHDLNSDDDFDCSNGYSDSYGSNGRMSNANGMSKAELRKVC